MMRASELDKSIIGKTAFVTTEEKVGTTARAFIAKGIIIRLSTNFLTIRTIAGVEILNIKNIVKMIIQTKK